MKNVLIGVFAHPDDEAFGPSAYLYRQAHSGTDVHLILLTDGDAGVNNGYANLAAQRLAEWQESGKRIGVTSQTALHYPDGKLSNDIYLEVANAVSRQIERIALDYAEKVKITLLTFERNGISGHLDHIAASFITTFVFEKLNHEPPQNVIAHSLLYYCLPSAIMPHPNTTWLFMPAGYPENAISLRHEYSDMVDIKLHIMQAHVSQKADMDSIVARQKNLKGKALAATTTDHFIVYQSLAQ